MALIASGYCDRKASSRRSAMRSSRRRSTGRAGDRNFIELHQPGWFCPHSCADNGFRVSRDRWFFRPENAPWNQGAMLYPVPIVSTRTADRQTLTLATGALSLCCVSILVLSRRVLLRPRPPRPSRPPRPPDSEQSCLTGWPSSLTGCGRLLAGPEHRAHGRPPVPSLPAHRHDRWVLRECAATNETKGNALPLSLSACRVRFLSQKRDRKAFPVSFPVSVCRCVSTVPTAASFSLPSHPLTQSCCCCCCDRRPPPPPGTTRSTGCTSTRLRASGRPSCCEPCASAAVLIHVAHALLMQFLCIAYAILMHWRRNYRPDALADSAQPPIFDSAGGAAVLFAQDYLDFLGNLSDTLHRR